MWGLLPFLLLDSDMKIPEEQVLRVSPLLPLQFISYLFLTVKMSVLSSLTPVSGTFGHACWEQLSICPGTKPSVNKL